MPPTPRSVRGDSGQESADGARSTQGLADTPDERSYPSAAPADRLFPPAGTAVACVEDPPRRDRAGLERFFPSSLPARPREED